MGHICHIYACLRHAVCFALFVLRFGVVGALVLFWGLFVAIASSVSLPPSCCSNNDTRSAFFPVVFSPLFASSSFNSTTFRDDQSFVGLFVARSLFRDDETLESSASGMSLFEEARIVPRTPAGCITAVRGHANRVTDTQSASHIRAAPC